MSVWVCVDCFSAQCKRKERCGQGDRDGEGEGEGNGTVSLTQ